MLHLQPLPPPGPQPAAGPARLALRARAAAVLATAAEKREAGPDLKALHAKIGQQVLEIDFLAGALGRIGDASAK